MSEINNSPISGKIGNIEIKDIDEKLLHAYHLDEGAGDVAYDSVGTANGTITNHTPASFFVEDARFYSYQNRLGYSEDVVDNVELVTNHDFTSGTSGWTPRSSTTKLTSEIDGMKVLVDGFVIGYGWQGITTVIGNKYRWLIDIIERTSENVVMKIGSDGVGTSSNVNETITDLGITTGTFTATGTTTWVSPYIFVDGKYAVLREVSIMEIPKGLIPIALTEDGLSTHLDVFGNVPTVDGQTKNNCKVVGSNALEFDGSTGYTLLDEKIILDNSSPWKISMRINPSIVQYHLLSDQSSGGNSRIGLASSIGVFISTTDNTDYGTGVITSIINEFIVVEVENTGSSVIATYNGEEKTLTTDASFFTKTITINNFGSKRAVATSLGAFDGLIDYIIITKPNKTYTYNFSEGAGDVAYDRAEVAYGDTVINEGFESGLNGWVSGGTLNIDASVVHSGDQSAKLVSSGNNIGINKSFTFPETGMYEASVWVYVQSASAQAWSVRNVTDVANWDIGNRIAPIGEWYNIKGVMSVTAGTKLINIYNNITSTATIYYDDILFRRIFEPINGTLTNGPTWTTDEKATPDNLINGFSNGLVCGTSGTTYKESTQAYGTWEFELTKEGLGFSQYAFINDANSILNGYVLELTASEQIALARYTGGSRAYLIYTIGEYIDENVMYKYRIARDIANGFTVEIKGGIWVDWHTPINTYGGTYPKQDTSHVTSTTQVLNLISGDKISNLKLDDEVIDLHSFITGTGVYSKLYIPSQTGKTGLDVNGNTLSNPAYKAGVGHNNAESKYLNYPVASLIKEDMLPGGVYDVPMKYLYGEELATNGHFDSDSGWSKQAGWTIADGKASCDGRAANLSQNGAVEAGKTYKVLIKITDYVSGSASVYVGGDSCGVFTANGLYSYEKTAGTTAFAIYSGSFVGSIDFISVKEVDDQTPAEIEYRDIVYDAYELDPYHRAFANAEELKKRDIVIYDTEQTGDALDKIYKAIKDPILRDQDGLPILDEDGMVIETN